MEELKGYLKLSHLSKYADLSVSTLRGMIKVGLPSFKLDGVILVRVSDFNDWMEQYQVGESPRQIVEEMLK